MLNGFLCTHNKLYVLYELIVSRRRIPEEFMGVSNMYWVGRILDVRLLSVRFFRF